MEKNKKRLIIFMPSMEGGGVEKNVILISNYISKFVKEVNFITFDKRFNKFFNKKIKILNVKNINGKKKYKKYYKYFKCLNLLIKEYLKNKNSLVFSFQANIYAIILSSFLGFKIISRSNSSPTGWGKNAVKNILFRIFFKFSDAIIVNSKEFQMEFRKKFNISTKLIYNPLNKNEIIKKSRIRLKSNFFNSKKFLKIISIGRFTEQKDHETLLKSFKIICKKINARLIIMGYGIKEKEIKNYVKNNNLNKYVKILNFKSNPFNYIKKTDLFILTSKFEGLPNVLLEAQLLKKYIISSDCPTGPREILLNGKAGGLFEVGNYRDLANKILKFNQNRSFYKPKINFGYKKLDRFDFKINCNKYLKLVQNYM